MRIAIFTETYIPEVNGVVYHIETLRRGLLELGHEVLVVRPDYTADKVYIENGVLYSPAKKIKQIYNYSFAYPWSKKRLEVLAEWAPDILHIQHEFSMGLFALYASRKLKIPVVYTCHTMYYDYAYYFGFLKDTVLVKALINAWIRKFAHKAKAVTCASTKMENFLHNCGVKKSIYKIPNTCVTSDFAISRLDKETFLNLKSKYAVNAEDMNICFCGRLAEEKNLLLSLDYVYKIKYLFPMLRFFIIGDGPDKQKLVKKIKELGLEHTVILCGKVEHALLKYYYHLCDAYFMTSLSENHSISALEAMACGLTVIHLFDKNNEEHYIEGLTGFSFNNVDELKEISQKVYNLNRPKDGSKTLKSKIIDASYKIDYKLSSEKTVNVYKNVLATQ